MQKLTEYQELLVITMEECGELIQACSKALRRQDIDDQNLKDEIGDVMCMIELMQEWDIVGWTEIENRVEHKRDKLKQWSGLVDDED
jgi:NTP pyrophosphatase (non-canonical NTP hydrolase)|tara:strand:+ start:586 stop:846 length:261 start_codon:yes stop_codon:yes gene_type:complete